MPAPLSGLAFFETSSERSRPEIQGQNRFVAPKHPLPPLLTSPGLPRERRRIRTSIGARAVRSPEGGEPPCILLGLAHLDHAESVSHGIRSAASTRPRRARRGLGRPHPANPGDHPSPGGLRRPVVATVGDQDHILWEISNEAPRESVPWQYNLARWMRMRGRRKRGGR